MILTLIEGTRNRSAGCGFWIVVAASRLVTPDVLLPAKVAQQQHATHADRDHCQIVDGQQR